MRNDVREDRRRRRILVPLATLTVAAAVAVGSGATYTSSSDVHASITAGKLVATNDHDKGTLSIKKLKPGARVTGTVRLTEAADSDLDSELSVELSDVTSGFESGAVQVTITGNGETATVDLEDISGTGAGIDLGDLADGWGATDVDITVHMPASAENANQGKAGGADLTFVLTATDGGDSQTTATWS